MTRKDPTIAPRTLDELLFHMPAVAQWARTKWAKDFARSVIKQSRFRNWKPTPKQHAMIRQMVSDLFDRTRDQDESFDLIEH